MREHKQIILSESFNKFLNEMLKQYNVSRDEVMHAAKTFGDFRGKIWAYCIVQNYLKKKGLPTEEARVSVVNRWFPS